MKDIYIVSDVHGNYEGLRKALFSAGLFDNHGVKDPNAFIVQIGDLANCVYGSREDDLRCLDMVGKEIDLMLVGNHEIPYFDPENTFSGFRFNFDISQTLWAHYANGLLTSSYCEDDSWLVTHAGISQSQLNFGTGTTPLLVNDKLQHEWKEKNFAHYLFRDCGRVRFGDAKVGGVLWCDFDREFEPTEFPQIVGHTPGVLRQKGNALCIDTGAKFGGIPTVLKLEV